ncbi:MAG: hypothetical protein KJ072_06245 [Verrucomicrobia bacterium]|nr:hypothetical protein [Verrucomicrobiota bacterium]
MNDHSLGAGSATNSHRWQFFRIGGFDQVNLTSGRDLLALDQLDQKLWVALSCPTRGLEFDPQTLDLIDTDKDGHIRVPEIIAAVKWAGSLLNDPDELLKESAELPLQAINVNSPEGTRILASARQILANLGKPDAQSISLSDTADTTRIFAQTKLNGDGIVPADATDDASLKTVIQNIIDCLGAETDRSGKPGVNQAKTDQFFADAQAYCAWHQKALSDKSILPLGDATAAASATVKSLAVKINDFFARCRLAAFDSRALAALNREEKEFLALAAKDLTITTSEIAGFPLARIEPDKALPLKEGVNPAWAATLATFRATVVKPLLDDRSTLTEADWSTLVAKLSPYETWAAAKAGATVEKLGPTRLQEILASPAHKSITALIASDKALEPQSNAIASVDKLLRFHRDLYRLLNNFVAFRDFYGRERKAVFQAGTLYLDRRSCELCLRVDDAGKHAALAGLSRTYLAYCDLTRKGSPEKMTIAAAFTNGDSDNLMVGRNGIFYDRHGQDWNATITKVVEQPISIRQAFWSPYKKFIRLIESQAEKLASAREKAVQDSAEAKVVAAATAAPTDPAKTGPTKKEAFDVAKFAGIFAAIGLAIGAIGGALAGLLGAFGKLVWWQMPLAIIGIMLLISGPSMILAWLKLRQRNLGPILDANGWAVNARAKINLPFGASLTGIAKLPPNSQRNLSDPFAEKKSGRNWLIAFLILVVAIGGLWYFGLLNKYLPSLPKSPYLKKQEQTTSEPSSTPAANPAPASTNTTPAPAN